ncbi:MAG: SH3 domain-containing protein [Roseiflexus sp.]|jgi:serine/threonine protein kinase|nr:SH3 domain-containing protein [Roseiflexus sp.]MBO9333880.1 SH3 domain-containing protein [Roseiflexus sp.]MBO9363716.1 SH3 domain-containing protein [Roseiflexus sp.]MBO9380935.1 SH3 domain-containing protein [Roseiflexus sp.]MBO9388023.1 SH3 domain-containing protein [Roseiflexus sp.]
MAQSPTPTALVLHNRYRIDERLGATRLAVVYRAYDERLQRRVLVAMLRKELIDQEMLRRRFVTEAQFGARHLHPSLLHVYDSGEVAGRPFMVTEYVSGRTLREFGPLTVEVALLYFRQIVGAVAACQAAGAPHPPISSANVMLVNEGHVELIENWSMTPAEFGLDVAAYRAPECTSGQPPSSASVVYSLGLLLIEMLTGRRVVEGADLDGILQAQRNLALPTLSAMRSHIYLPSLARLLVRATAPDPSQRFPDALALSQALDEVWRSTSRDTDRLALPRHPDLTGRQASAAAPPLNVRPAPFASVPSPSPTAPVTTIDTHQLMLQSARQRSLAALIAMVALFVLVGSGAYVLTSLALEGLTSIRLPRLQVLLPEGITLPDWLTGVADGSGEVLIVTIGDVEGLNLRAEPGLNTRIIGLLPNGTRVRKLEGPRIVDNVPWVRVRGEINGQPVEGWVSQLFVRTE